MHCGISSWLCAGALAAVSCSWHALGRGPPCKPGDDASAPRGHPHPERACYGDTYLLQSFAHAEPQLQQWNTDDVWAVDALDGSRLQETGPTAAARPLPATATMDLLQLNMSHLQVLFANVSEGYQTSVNNTVIWLAGAFLCVILSGTMFLCVNKLHGSSSQQSSGTPPTKDKRGAGVSKTNTMLSSVSIRSDRSQTSYSPGRAGKLLSDKCRGKRLSSSMQPRARMVPSSTEPRMMAQATEPGSSIVQAVATQRMGSQGNISLGGVSATSASVDGRFEVQSGPGCGPGDCRFMVPVDTLVEAAEEGTFSITDMASGLLLRVGIVNLQDGSRNLQVFVGKDTPSPCTTVRPLTSGGSNHSMEIKGANGLPFGMLTLQANGSFLVTTVEQQPLLIIEGNEANLDLRISARDGRLVAAVSCNESSPSKGVEHVEFRVLPGTDPVLVVSCILSVLLLGGDDDE